MRLLVRRAKHQMGNVNIQTPVMEANVRLISTAVVAVTWLLMGIYCVTDELLQLNELMAYISDYT